MRLTTTILACALVPAAAGAGAPVDFLQLPDGFRAEVLVDGVANARSMALAADGTLYVGTRSGGNVYAVRGALGGSVQVGPFVAAALALVDPAGPREPEALLVRDVAHLRGLSATGRPLDAFLVAEDTHAASGGGHERADPLALALFVDGTMALAPPRTSRIE